MKPAAIVYLATNLVNGKTYVGITRYSIAKRWAEHKHNALTIKRSWFHRAIAKHGAEKFSVVAVASCLTLDEASAVEREVILAFEPTYNQTNGGEFTIGRKHSPAVVAKIAASNRGKKRTPEQNAANSAQAKARHENNPVYAAAAKERLCRGLAMVDQEKRKAAAARACRERTWSTESRAKLSASCTGRRHSKEVLERIAESKQKPLECTTLNTVFDCCQDAAANLGLSTSSIYKVLAGARKSVKGLHFSYV